MIFLEVINAADCKYATHFGPFVESVVDIPNSQLEIGPILTNAMYVHIFVALLETLKKGILFVIWALELDVDLG